MKVEQQRNERPESTDNVSLTPFLPCRLLMGSFEGESPIWNEYLQWGMVRFSGVLRLSRLPFLISTMSGEGVDGWCRSLSTQKPKHERKKTNKWWKKTNKKTNKWLKYSHYTNFFDEETKPCHHAQKERKIKTRQRSTTAETENLHSVKLAKQKRPQ